MDCAEHKIGVISCASFSKLKVLRQRSEKFNLSRALEVDVSVATSDIMYILHPEHAYIVQIEALSSATINYH
jgi:hypothetical protein